MKKIIIGLLGLLLAACSKKNSPALPSVTYTLYNYSSGSPQNAGTFTIYQRADSNASLTIRLTSSYFSRGVNFTASIVTTDTSSQTLVYASLQPVSGDNGANIQAKGVIP